MTQYEKMIRIQESNNNSKKYIKNNNITMGITIGPYTNAGALREIQKLVAL